MYWENKEKSLIDHICIFGNLFQKKAFTLDGLPKLFDVCLQGSIANM